MNTANKPEELRKSLRKCIDVAYLNILDIMRAFEAEAHHRSILERRCADAEQANALLNHERQELEAQLAQYMASYQQVDSAASYKQQAEAAASQIVALESRIRDYAKLNEEQAATILALQDDNERLREIVERVRRERDESAARIAALKTALAEQRSITERVLGAKQHKAPAPHWVPRPETPNRSSDAHSDELLFSGFRLSVVEDMADTVRCDMQRGVSRKNAIRNAPICCTAIAPEAYGAFARALDQYLRLQGDPDSQYSLIRFDRCNATQSREPVGQRGHWLCCKKAGHTGSHLFPGT